MHWQPAIALLEALHQLSLVELAVAIRVPQLEHQVHALLWRALASQRQARQQLPFVDGACRPSRVNA